ncbi:MAG: 2-C-methyl-D-erythritol 4-phosphate cytidylyltransferase [Candidatus Cryptobacteroides sp.]
MEKKVYAIFVAGGSGQRMGSSTPKQFLDLAGRPVLLRTLERFIAALPDLHVITVLPQQHFSTWVNICREYHFEYPQRLVAGGLTRFHSVKNALKFIPDDALVLVHDGVRPNASLELIRRVVDRAAEGDCVIPVIPVTDTLKCLLPSQNSGEFVESGEESPDRSRLFGAQTPQVFSAEFLKEAYQTNFLPSYTDDASVLRNKNIPLTYILGERYNIKVTTPEDLAFLSKVY